MADALECARASLESHGHMALDWLLQLERHHTFCTRMEPLLCSTHIDLSAKFITQLAMMDDCRIWIERTDGSNRRVLSWPG